MPRSEEIIDAFKKQADWCFEFGSPFTSQLITKLAENIGARGIVFELVGDWQGHIIADALALRLCGGLHFLALSGMSQQLQANYPASNPKWNIENIWSIAESELIARQEWFADFIKSPPQTNEVRRAIGLYLGMCRAAENWDGALDVLELGASAGLNQNLDMFDYDLPEFKKCSGFGVELTVDEWRGNRLNGGKLLAFRNRAACDQNPLNANHANDALLLEAYVWPDQNARLKRVHAAIGLAKAQATQVDKADAAAWLVQKLKTRAKDALTIVFHSVFFQYPPEAVRRAIHEMMVTEIAKSSENAPLAWVRLEPSAVLYDVDGKIGRESDHWPSIGHVVDVIDFDFEAGSLRRRILAKIDPHGRWIEWSD
ncbi:MAG: hypothetical protein FD163_1994 [Hyphomonadaceae bacterium]|nr:MAG: hypothetical protein FD163_1994 [Hyphomonadaceae bacterium]